MDSKLQQYVVEEYGEEILYYAAQRPFYVDGIYYDPMMDISYHCDAMITLQDDDCHCDDISLPGGCPNVGRGVEGEPMGPRPEWSREGNVDTIV